MQLECHTFAAAAGKCQLFAMDPSSLPEMWYWLGPAGHEMEEQDALWLDRRQVKDINYQLVIKNKKANFVILENLYYLYTYVSFVFPCLVILIQLIQLSTIEHLSIVLIFFINTCVFLNYIN